LGPDDDAGARSGEVLALDPAPAGGSAPLVKIDPISLQNRHTVRRRVTPSATGLRRPHQLTRGAAPGFGTQITTGTVAARRSERRASRARRVTAESLPPPGRLTDRSVK
jgi:hypothetical protein